jgi:hypothetical protein
MVWLNDYDYVCMWMNVFNREAARITINHPQDTMNTIQSQRYLQKTSKS